VRCGSSVAGVAAFVASGLGAAGVLLPWWIEGSGLLGQGVVLDPLQEAKLGVGVGLTALSASLWEVEAQETDALGDVVGGAETMTWEAACAVEEAKGGPSSAVCFTVNTVRIFILIAAALDFISCTLLFLAYRLSSLLCLLGGAISAALGCGGFGAGVLLALMLGSGAGLTGPGFMCCGGALALTVFVHTMSIYAAAKATPDDASAYEEKEAEPPRLDRMREAWGEEYSLKLELYSPNATAISKADESSLVEEAGSPSPIKAGCSPIPTIKEETADESDGNVLTHPNELSQDAAEESGGNELGMLSAPPEESSLLAASPGPDSDEEDDAEEEIHVAVGETEIFPFSNLVNDTDVLSDFDSPKFVVEKTIRRGGNRVPVKLKRIIDWDKDNQHRGQPPNVPKQFLIDAFQEIDEDGQGIITEAELTKGLALCGLDTEPDAMARIIQDVDKDANGDITCKEFVSFFRTIEEINDMERDARRRASFFECMCNLCFVLHVIGVSLLVMMIVRMQGDSDSNGYQMMQTALSGLSFTFAILFFCVIGLPMLRLTLASSVRSWKIHFRATLKQQRRKRQKQREAKEREKAEQAEAARLAAEAAEAEARAQDDADAGGLRTAAEGDEEGAAVVKSLALEEEAGPPMAKQQSLRSSQSSVGSLFRSKTIKEKPVGYDPEAYRHAAMLAANSYNGGRPGTFATMQCLNLEVPLSLRQHALPQAVVQPDVMLEWKGERGFRDLPRD